MTHNGVSGRSPDQVFVWIDCVQAVHTKHFLSQTLQRIPSQTLQRIPTKGQGTRPGAARPGLKAGVGEGRCRGRRTMGIFCRRPVRGGLAVKAIAANSTAHLAALAAER